MWNLLMVRTRNHFKFYVFRLQRPSKILNEGDGSNIIEVAWQEIGFMEYSADKISEHFAFYKLLFLMLMCRTLCMVWFIQIWVYQLKIAVLNSRNKFVQNVEALRSLLWRNRTDWQKLETFLDWMQLFLWVLYSPCHTFLTNMGFRTCNVDTGAKGKRDIKNLKTSM